MATPTPLKLAWDPSPDPTRGVGFTALPPQLPINEIDPTIAEEAYALRHKPAAWDAFCSACELPSGKAMLLCSGCATSCHTSCLPHPQRGLPTAAWACDSCVHDISSGDISAWATLPDSPPSSPLQGDPPQHRHLIDRFLRREKIGGIVCYWI